MYSNIMQSYGNNSAFRKLTDAERAQLAAQNCFAEDWNSVEVADGFDAGGIRNCSFSGKVAIEKEVRIQNIGSHIANMVICEGASITNTGVIETVGSCSFGVGTMVKTINEAGGREIPIYPGLSAQVAYIAAMYREREQVAEKIAEMVDREYTRPRTSDMGCIGRGAVITGCGTLRNVCIEGNAVIEGAAMLSNGTVVSTGFKQTYIGPGVKMYDFVAASGAYIDNGSLLKRCFVGGAVNISQLTATDSVFFSNSECENGEFSNVFAGPFTVSHHKSTLLIAGMFSFYNAGSNTNMSNHHFKSGPVHQGVFRRGCKTGSGSYIMLPALIGAYNTVVGSHRMHPETDDFPFSVLREENGDSYLIPAINLGSSGTARDIRKWVERDKRESSSPDIITFNENNPLITQKVLKALEVTDKLLQREDVDTYSYRRMKIKATMLKRGQKLYLMAKDRYIGSMLARGEDRIQTGFAAADNAQGTGLWIDAAGMYIPKDAMDILLDTIANEEGFSIAKLTETLDAINRNYKHYAYNWALSVLESELDRKASQEDVALSIRKARMAAPKLVQLIDDDIRKECDAGLSVGYGLDADNDYDRMADYNNVRGIRR